MSLKIVWVIKVLNTNKMEKGMTMSGMKNVRKKF